MSKKHKKRPTFGTPIKVPVGGGMEDGEIKATEALMRAKGLSDEEIEANLRELETLEVVETLLSMEAAAPLAEDELAGDDYWLAHPEFAPYMTHESQKRVWGRILSKRDGPPETVAEKKPKPTDKDLREKSRQAWRPKGWDSYTGTLPGPTGTTARHAASSTSVVSYSGGAVTSYSSGKPAPFVFHPTGLPGIWGGRQPLTKKDAHRLFNDTGVRFVLDLREPKEWTKPNIGQEPIDEFQALGVARLSVPVTDMTAPKPEDFARAVAAIDYARQKNLNVLVHCRGGRERTAAILLAYAAKYLTGGDPEAAWDRMDPYPLLCPLETQVSAALAWLGVKGYIPCSTCHRPLSVGKHIARAYCLACERSWEKKQRSYTKDHNGWKDPAGSDPRGQGSLFTQSGIDTYKALAGYDPTGKVAPPVPAIPEAPIGDEEFWESTDRGDPFADGSNYEGGYGWLNGKEKYEPPTG